MRNLTKIKKLDQETIKKINQNNVLYLLYRHDQLTKHDIAKKLGISIPTVVTNINELIELGFVEEAGVGKSTGGRKPVIVKFLPDSRYSMGVVITKDYVRMVLTNLHFEIIKEVSISIDEELQSIDYIIEAVKEFQKNVCEELSIDENKILGIGFSLPGTVNEKTLILENAINLGIKNIDFKNYDFNCPVYIENEANASAYAEYFVYPDKSNSKLIFVSITEGIGTGIVFNSLLYKGANKRAGEWGHMTIVKDGKSCACGKNGCWEVYASSKALLKTYNKDTGLKRRNISEIFMELDEDYKTQKVVDEYLEYLAEGIKNIILIMDPDKIVIGGEIAFYEDYIKEALNEKVYKPNAFFTAKDCKIEFTKLKANASVIGAALLPVMPLFFNNNITI
ncbi:ROK family transcriptional regulator [Clostridium cellulovorans]|uniref:ROK family transcriptional regulator n=1 Tax=Clostridium cellulovorans TaxID=1493 RepID=UPI0001A9745B|nr:ROK family transcriptional regulator [Clostridium cellulovorans]